MSERSKMLREVQSLDFALHEAALFLDVHKDDKNALKYFNHYRGLSDAARAKFQERFGPLEYRLGNVSERWEWVQGPWPWECQDREGGVV